MYKRQIMDWDPLLLSLEAALIATLVAGVVGVTLGALLALSLIHI